MVIALCILGLLRPMDGAGSEAGGGAGTPPPSSTPVSTSTASTPVSGSTPPASTPNANTPDPAAGTGNTNTNPPDPNVNDPAYGNWKALRDQRDQYQRQLTETQAQAQQWATVSTEAQSLATRLGYSAEDFAAAFKADPIKTLSILREQAGQAPDPQRQNPNDPKSIQDLIRKEMEPINNVVNQQITEAAMVKYNTTLDTSISADPILKDAPEQVKSLVKDYLGEYFATQPEVMLAMKMKGDFSAVKDGLTYIAGRLHTAFSEWAKIRNGGGGNPNPLANNNPAPPNARPTLDQIINDPSVLGDQYR